MLLSANTGITKSVFSRGSISLMNHLLSWRILRLLEFGVIEIEISDIFDGDRFSTPTVRFCITAVRRYGGVDNFIIDTELVGPTIKSTVLVAVTWFPDRKSVV